LGRNGWSAVRSMDFAKVSDIMGGNPCEAYPEYKSTGWIKSNVLVKNGVDGIDFRLSKSFWNGKPITVNLDTNEPYYKELQGKMSY